jgi:hypothetical protein
MDVDRAYAALAFQSAERVVVGGHQATRAVLGHVRDESEHGVTFGRGIAATTSGRRSVTP